MKYISDYLNIIPLQINQATAAATSAKVRVDRGGGGDFSILCQVGFHTTVDIGGCTGGDLSATDAGNAIDFTVVEATAASAAGSAITGATLTLGPATVCVSRGGVISAIEVTSNLTTAVSITVNGRAYHTDTAGPGRDGENVATELAAILNGRGTNEPIPHYEAIANGYTTGLVVLHPTDDQATGLTIVTTAAGSTYRPLPGIAQGCINIQMSKLSSNTPKYIGVVCGESSAAVGRAVSLCRFPTANGSFPGAVVNVTT
jgi:hypothetical protein